MIDISLRTNPDAEHWNIAALDTAAKINTLSPLEKDVILEMNKVRSDPRKYAQMYIKPMIGNYEGNKYRTANGRLFATKEGDAPAKECFEALSAAQAVGLLVPVNGLYLAAKDHAVDQGSTGTFMHVGTDGSTSKERIWRYGVPDKTFSGWGENIIYGPDNARDIVCLLLIDDGVPDRGHRENLMEPNFTQTAAYFGPHPVAKWVCVITYAAGFNNQMEDYAEVVKLYGKAAEDGNAKAQFNLGFCYGKGQGVAQDYAKAVEWWQKAADQGYAPAQFALGLSYKMGLGVPQDYAKAIEWYRKAADQGDAQAQSGLGICYDNGQGVVADHAKAAEWYRKAAEQGNALSQYNLGFCYLYGQGLSKDDAKAVEWFRKAAEQGNVNAQYNLGVAYYNGQGIPQDYDLAASWLCKAAAQGDADAKKAIFEFFSKAAEHGDANAKNALDMLKRESLILQVRNEELGIRNEE